MDTNPYSNIMKAMNGNSKLTPEQEAQNYNTFSELMKQGVSLPDLISKIDALETKVKVMEENSNQSAVNQELFEVMEAAVKNDPEVKNAKQIVASAKSAVIHDMCMNDPRYKESLDEYRKLVNRIYIRQKEQTQ